MVEISKQVKYKCSLITSEPSPNDHSQVFPRYLLGGWHGRSQDQCSQELSLYSVEEKLGVDAK